MRDTKTNVTSMKNRNWYEIKNAAADTAEVFIYDQIGADWFGDGVTAKGFIDELNTITAGNIDLHLNSPGGSVFDGVAIFNALKRHPANITTYVDGLAASIASIIALAGERVVMAKNSLFMIHNPWGVVQGDANDMRKMADVLDKIKETLVNQYADRTGMTSDELNTLLDSETWYTADEALAAGFIDEIGVTLQAAASFDLANLGFKHVPQNAGSTLSTEDLAKLAEAGDKINEVISEAGIDTAPEADPADPEADGSSNSVTSDGALEDSTPEVNPQADTKFVDGIGFITFNRKE